MAHLTESEVESAALSWLEGLGYTILHGAEIAPDEPRRRVGPHDALA